MEMKAFSIDFKKFISSVSLALDLAEACAFRDQSKKFDFDVSIPGFSIYSHNFASHSKKTALVSMLLAKELGFRGTRLDNLYIASFLHDIGAVDAFSECHSDKSFIYEHSEFGSQIVKKLPVDSSISRFIKFHHENYDGSGPNCVSGSDIPEESSIIHVADLFELMYRDDVPNSLQRKKIQQWFNEKKGRFFAPHIVDALLSATESERFWLDMENINSDPDILDRIHPAIYTPITLNILNDIALVFATIIDRKSSFTHQHSIGLTNHVSSFSKYYGFDEEKTTRMRIAGLLHDLGKLSIPNNILDKHGKLTSEEYTSIRSHTYYTKLILEKVSGMEQISDWAANHHETLRGSGYPERLGAEKLSLESRIIAVCDIYQALTEDRPYRGGMTKENSLKIIDSMVNVGNIDADVVKVLKEII